MSLITVDSADKTGEKRLELRSRMSDLALVPPWVDHLAAEYAISAGTQFAMNLCLEEVVSNIIRHGYGFQDGPIVIRYKREELSSLLVVEDQAPPFNPLEVERLPLEEVLDGDRVGGLGLRLVHGFASELKYQVTPTGNQLVIGFSTP